MKPGKMFAAFLFSLLVFGVSVLSALEGGPVMPEYVQFEPADAPDIVNLNTGDFSYTLPLSEVPGPYGNFPLAMSYHAGIGPNQEATWVGLGWTLNPGAINRNLRGTPDDQSHGGDLAFVYAYSSIDVTFVDVNLSIGYIGLDMSHTSMGGYGFNATVGYNVGIFKAQVSIGTSGIGLNVSSGALKGGIGLGHGGLQGNAGIDYGPINGSIGYGPGGFYAGAGVGLGATSPMGATVQASAGISISGSGKVATYSGFGLDAGFAHVGLSSNGSVSASVAGLGGTVNLTSRGYSVSISVPGTPGLGVSAASDVRGSNSDHSAGITIPGLSSYSRTIYQSWVRQATSEHTYGYMYQAGPAIDVDGPSEDVATTAYPGRGTEGGGEGTGGFIPWNWNFKGRSLDHVGNPTTGNLFPGYDIFEVASQGISGAFRPMGLSRQEIVQSVEPLDEHGFGGGSEPNVLYYLLKEDTGSVPALRRQKILDFDVAQDTVTAAHFTRFAYDYCFDSTAADTLNVHYVGDESKSARFQRIKDNLCSRYAILESNHLNEGNRLLFSRNPKTNLDLNKKFRNRMVFAFMGENGGYFESEDYTDTAKKSRDALAAFLLKKRIQKWRHSPYAPDQQEWNEPIISARRIEPVLEDNSNIGRLKGFKITNGDGTQYFFTQPVRTLMSASYTTNQPQGSPAFVDKINPRASDNWRDILRNTLGTLQDYPLSSWMKQLGDLFVGGVRDFLFNSPEFKDKCQDDKTHTSTYQFSYTMSTNPYATQWLLTEIRGPDFVEFDPNDMTKNFGYQVKFHYTEPAHYNWRAPYAPPGMSSDSLPNLRLPRNGMTPENCLSELYHASFGVKELVYLQSIETATHKAVFHLNDIDTNPRIDGKGWVFRWLGEFDKIPNVDSTLPNQRDSILREKRLGIPIMVGTHFPIRKIVNTASATPQTAYLYRHDVDNSGQDQAQFVSSLHWTHYTVSYSVDQVFLDIQPTEEQIRKMIGDTLVISGVSKLATHDTLRFKALPPSDSAGKSFYALHGHNTGTLSDTIKVVPGYKVPAAAPAVGYGLEGKVISAVVDTVVRAHGDELQFGSYKILFKQPVAISDGNVEDGSLDSGFTLDQGVGDSLYFANFDLENQGIVPKGDAVILKLTSGGGDFRGLANQPLLVFNDFVDFNQEKTANQMRYLTHLDLIDKMRPDEPYKRFNFAYANDIMPKTLNSYKLLDTDTTDRVAQHRRSYPTAFDLDNPASDTTQPDTVLLGKLKLESVTEVACAGIDCADSMTLPPYRFYYQNPEATPFVAGVKPSIFVLPGDTLSDSRQQTLRMSQEREDEWGFYNPNASTGNLKTTQQSADFGGAVWSLNRIVDPLGGVMDISYERDTYYGEDYSDDRDAQGMLWGPCDQDSSKVCLYFMPKKWQSYCDRWDHLQGDWVYTDSGSNQGFDYIQQEGFVPGAEMLFNLQQTAVTEVGCGVNLGFAKLGGCDRHRSVSVVGSAQILSTARVQNVQTPLFDAQKYYRDLDNGNDVTGPCEGRSDCCESVTLFGDTIPRGQYWHCGYPAYRIETGLSLDSLNAQFLKTVGKLKEHRHWDISGGYNERFGAVWVRKSTLVKGGDIRVRELVKHDIGLTERTRYEYEPGQLAQYPDSVFSTAFATRFSTGKITDILGTGFTGNYFKAFRHLPSQSRVPGIPDEDRFLLPGPQISYPKVTVTNILEKENGAVSVLNGKTEFTFAGPEQIGFIDIQVDSFSTASGTEPRNFYVDYFDGAGARMFTRDRFDIKSMSQNPLNGGMVYHYQVLRRDDSDPTGHKASAIRRLRFLSDAIGTDGMDDSVDLVLNTPTPAAPRVTVHLKGSLSAAGFQLERDSSQGVAGETHDYFDFPTPILVKQEVGDSITYLDYTSRIGKSKATSFYRWMPDTTGGRPGQPGHYALLKRDSMVYRSTAPSVDTRFIGSADTARVGRQKEVWSYVRERKCDSAATDSSIVACHDDQDTSQWKAYKDMPREKTVAQVRFPTFLVLSQSVTGFSDSHQPGDTALHGGTDFIVTTVTNHFFDPVTGQPTLTVFHGGEAPGAPSKVTRMTPAYATDSGQATSDVPMTLFEKNMLEPNFRTDAFTFPESTPIASFDDPALVSGSNGDNGGLLAAHLTAVTVTPYRPYFLTQVNGRPSLAEDTAGQAEVTEPILKVGDFLPRFALSWAADSLSRNRDLITRRPSLQSWKGSHIVQVDRFLKSLEVEDAYGRPLSNRYDPRGFHQVGLFSPAPYWETATLTADGYPSGADSLGDWVFYGNAPAHANGALSFTSPFNVRQRFDLSAQTSYTVECQIDSKSATEVAVKFEGTGGETWALKILPVLPGLHTYSTVLDSALWLSSPPAQGANNLVVYSNQNVEQVDLKYLRAYPKAAEARTYLYDERGDLTQSVDGAGVSTYYEYDLFGKLVGIRNDEGVLLTAGSREQVNK